MAKAPRSHRRSLFCGVILDNSFCSFVQYGQQWQPVRPFEILYGRAWHLDHTARVHRHRHEASAGSIMRAHFVERLGSFSGFDMVLQSCRNSWMHALVGNIFFFLSMLRPVCGSYVLQAIRPRPPTTAAVGAREGDWVLRPRPSQGGGRGAGPWRRAHAVVAATAYRGPCSLLPAARRRRACSTIVASIRRPQRNVTLAALCTLAPGLGPGASSARRR